MSKNSTEIAGCLVLEKVDTTDIYSTLNISHDCTVIFYYRPLADSNNLGLSVSDKCNDKNAAVKNMGNYSSGCVWGTFFTITLSMRGPSMSTTSKPAKTDQSAGRKQSRLYKKNRGHM